MYAFNILSKFRLRQALSFLPNRNFHFFCSVDLVMAITNSDFNDPPKVFNRVKVRRLGGLFYA